MIYVRAGSFVMGSPPSEAGRDNDEVQHKVTISKGFYLGKTEVTQAQWYKVMGTTVREQCNKAWNSDERCWWKNGSWVTLKQFMNSSASSPPAWLYGKIGVESRLSD
jgi:formylglycine-generating enzyme required for sulfatase activity